MGQNDIMIILGVLSAVHSIVSWSFPSIHISRKVASNISFDENSLFYLSVPSSSLVFWGGGEEALGSLSTASAILPIFMHTEMHFCANSSQYCVPYSSAKTLIKLIFKRKIKNINHNLQQNILSFLVLHSSSCSNTSRSNSVDAPEHSAASSEVALTNEGKGCLSSTTTIKIIHDYETVLFWTHSPHLSLCSPSLGVLLHPKWEPLIILIVDSSHLAGQSVPCTNAAVLCGQ